ncbi:MAG: hypothetical protein D6795_02375 [Deltaproteobacteria bacterium]|nr:MAG: hypothetical protein D6795_02375 [Deltaproteobacteria bacterium]
MPDPGRVPRVLRPDLGVRGRRRRNGNYGHGWRLDGALRKPGKGLRREREMHRELHDRKL